MNPDSNSVANTETTVNGSPSNFSRFFTAADWRRELVSTIASHGKPGHDGTPGNCAACHAEEFGA